MCGFVARSGETEPRVDRSRIMIEVRGRSLIPISEHSISVTVSRVHRSLTHNRLNLVSVASAKEGRQGRARGGAVAGPSRHSFSTSDFVASILTSTHPTALPGGFDSW